MDWLNCARRASHVVTKEMPTLEPMFRMTL